MNPGAISAELLEAYRATLYVVFAGDGEIVFRIDEHSPPLGKLMGTLHAAGACLVTGWNPFSHARADAENAEANRALRQELLSWGWTVYDAEGRDPSGAWPAEASYFACGPTRAESVGLCVRYRQHGVVFVERDAIPRLLLHPPRRLCLTAALSREEP